MSKVFPSYGTGKHMWSSWMRKSGAPCTALETVVVLDAQERRTQDSLAFIYFTRKSTLVKDKESSVVYLVNLVNLPGRDAIEIACFWAKAVKKCICTTPNQVHEVHKFTGGVELTVSHLVVAPFLCVFRCFSASFREEMNICVLLLSFRLHFALGHANLVNFSVLQCTCSK